MGKVTASHKPSPRPLPLPFSLTVGVSSDHPDPNEPRLEILNTVVRPSARQSVARCSRRRSPIKIKGIMDAESRTDEGQAGRGSPVQVGLERWVVGPEISGICRGGKDNIDLEMGEVAVVPLVW